LNVDPISVYPVLAIMLIMSINRVILLEWKIICLWTASKYPVNAHLHYKRTFII